MSLNRFKILVSRIFKKENVPLLIAVIILSFFVIWTVSKVQSFKGWDAKYSIFYRNYQKTGINPKHLFPAYNFLLTDPPSHIYLGKSPLVPLIMYSAARIFGDRPETYRGMIIIINVLFFSILSFFIARWWNIKAALWALFFASLSKYALLFGNTQTPEQLGVVGMFSAIFLYFEWLKTKQARFMALCGLAYFIGFAADYCAFFAMLVICLHWAFFVKEHKRSDLIKLSILPFITIFYSFLMVSFMLIARIPIYRWLGRAVARSTGSLWDRLLGSFISYHLEFIGPLVIISSLVFFILQHKRVNRIRYPFRLDILYCLLVSGSLFIIIFGNSYINHKFFVMYLLPFFVVSGAAGIDILLQQISNLWQKHILILVIVAIFLAMPFQVKGDNLILQRFSKHRSYSPSESLGEFVLKLKPTLKPQDKLLVLRNVGVPFGVTAFYFLWIPTVTSVGNWDKALIAEDYTLILTTNHESYKVARNLKNTEVLFTKDDFAFFRKKN